ncbi:MAG TPA: EcsC family protein [Terriglobales bacterium]|nr:EcsC family protein [Terriglobales bacterium]
MSNEGRTKSWLMKKAEGAIKSGLSQAYERVKVDPQEYLVHLRAGEGLAVNTYDGMFSVPVEELDRVAAETIRSGMKLAALEGAGFGMGGMLTLVPDMGILSAITLRTVQKLSLIYGFPYNTDAEVTELWIAMASAAGVDISRELVEKEVVQRFVPKVIQRIATRASTEVVEKWAGRLIPVVSSAIGAALNYYFLRAWSERAVKHFREKHLQVRSRMLALEAGEQPVLTDGYYGVEDSR